MCTEISLGFRAVRRDFLHLLSLTINGVVAVGGGDVGVGAAPLVLHARPLPRVEVAVRGVVVAHVVVVPLGAVRVRVPGPVPAIT